MVGSRHNTKIVVFASGRGTNFRALCAAARSGALPATISALVTNVCGAGACAIAREYGIPVLEVPHDKFKKRAEHEAELSRQLAGVEFDWIVLAGYMRLFTGEFVKKHRIVNIHPSLLPSFPGTDGYGQALRYGVKVTGVTVHLVGAGLDDGPIVAQEPLEVREGDTVESLSERGLAAEHKLYVRALTDLFTKRWNVANGGVAEGRARVVYE